MLYGYKMLPNKKKKNRLHCISQPLAAIVCIFLLFYYGCFSQEDNKEAKETNETESLEPNRYGGTYHYPLLNNPSTLDPAYVQDQYGAPIIRQVFEGLVQFDPYLTVSPALAETWEVENNGRTYRFFLRINAYFHNGHPVTVDDAFFSIRRLLRVNPPPFILPQLLKIEGAQAYRDRQSDQVRGLKRINDHEFLITLVEPHVPFLAALGMYQAAIVPKLEVDKNENKFGRAPVGSGPFQFVSWSTDESIKLERYSNYFAGKTYLDKIVYQIYLGGKIDSVLSDFRAGKLEEMPIYGNIRQELLDGNDYQWFHRPSLSLLFYGLRNNHPLLKFDAFRKALSLAIDRKKLVQQVYNGQFEPARSILPPGMPAHNKSEVLVVDNITAARKLMNEALKDGMDDALQIEIVSGVQSAFSRNELHYVRSRWEQLGLQVEIKFITNWLEFKRYIKSDAVQVYRYVWIADIPDPDNFLFPLFASDSPANFTRFRNTQIDQLLFDARGIVDPVRRAEKYQTIEKLVLKSCPIIPLFYLSIDRVYQPSVQGVKLNALAAEHVPYNRIWLNPLAPSTK